MAQKFRYSTSGDEGSTEYPGAFAGTQTCDQPSAPCYDSKTGRASEGGTLYQSRNQSFTLGRSTIDSRVEVSCGKRGVTEKAPKHGDIDRGLGFGAAQMVAAR
uniref:Uncharacterized protein n=1 Tax=Anopheles coluzzii TaxID=1518534 RepID=A0A8W7Q2Y8_ANOCL